MPAITYGHRRLPLAATLAIHLSRQPAGVVTRSADVARLLKTPVVHVRRAFANMSAEGKCRLAVDAEGATGWVWCGAEPPREWAARVEREAVAL